MRDKNHVSWLAVWLIYFCKIIDGVVGFVSFGFVPLDLSGTLANWAWLKRIEQYEKGKAHVKPGRSNRRKKATR